MRKSAWRDMARMATENAVTRLRHRMKIPVYFFAVSRCVVRRATWALMPAGSCISLAPSCGQRGSRRMARALLAWRRAASGGEERRGGDAAARASPRAQEYRGDDSV